MNKQQQIKQTEILKEIKKECKKYKEIKCILDYKVLNHQKINISFMGLINDIKEIYTTFNKTFLEIEYNKKENALKMFELIKQNFKFSFRNYLK